MAHHDFYYDLRRGYLLPQSSAIWNFVALWQVKFWITLWQVKCVISHKMYVLEKQESRTQTITIIRLKIIIFRGKWSCFTTDMSCPHALTGNRELWYNLYLLRLLTFILTLIPINLWMKVSKGHHPSSSCCVCVSVVCVCGVCLWCAQCQTDVSCTKNLNNLKHYWHHARRCSVNKLKVNLDVW